uniref:Uncharacterized protein n=1 Tax=Quercus lobata TaxID=97700 RepID=A0A7N2MQJ2_QUELO
MMHAFGFFCIFIQEEVFGQNRSLNPFHHLWMISSRHLLCRFTEPWNFGKPTQTCESCGAILCYEERNVKSGRSSQPKFSLCCLE